MPTRRRSARALDQAALADFVASLPEGLDTRVGERGVQLSGGQRQRVAIARAFLKNAPTLILDEATSHLDAVSEAQVRGALDALMRDRTTVVIAHRLSTVRSADLLVVLDRGHVAEFGSHAELVARNGLYARLIRRQLGGCANRSGRSGIEPFTGRRSGENPRRRRGEWKNAGSAEPVSMSRCSASAAARSAG